MLSKAILNKHGLMLGNRAGAGVPLVARALSTTSSEVAAFLKEVALPKAQRTPRPPVQLHEVLAKLSQKMTPIEKGSGPAAGETKKVAIIGGGISGLACAYQLKKDSRYNVTLFEAEKSLGGAVRTVHAKDPYGNEVAVDTGVVFTEENFYPNLYQLLSLPEFNVESEVVRVGMTGTFMGAGGQETTWSNVVTGLPLRSKFREESNRFMLELSNLKDIGVEKEMFGTTAGQWIKANGFSDEFVQQSVIPMLLTFAITRNGLLSVPLALLHLYFGGGALNFNNGSYGRRLKGGMQSYTDKMAAHLGDIAKTETRVLSIKRLADKAQGVEIATVRNGVTTTERFDEVVISVLKDSALKMLGDSASDAEKGAFNMIQYEDMDVFVHNDPEVLSPNLRRPDGSYDYQVFNYRYLGSDFGDYVRGATTYVPRFDLDVPNHQVALPLLTYANAEKFQGVVYPREDKIIDVHRFRHVRQGLSMFGAGIAAHKFNGTDRIHYCGNDVSINFHEAALCSGLIVAKRLGVAYPFDNSLKSSWVFNLFERYMTKGDPPMELLFLNPH